VEGKDGKEIRLRGINIADYSTKTTDLIKNLSFEDYKKIAGIGMNHIRLGLDPRLFWVEGKPGEINPQAWIWLDQQVNMAKAAGLYLILSMRSDPNLPASEPAFWENQDNLKQWATLWAAIAGRYKDEPAIAGYDLLDEPLPDNLTSWEDLAQNTANAIRKVDGNHLLIIQATQPPNRDFVYINDNNYMLEFHFFKPDQFTLFADGNYPDSSLYIPNWENLFAVDNTNVVSLLPGTTDWFEYGGTFNVIYSRETRVGFPSLDCSQNSGTAYFSNFVIEEYDAGGHFIKNVVDVDFSKDTYLGWWSEDGSGSSELVNDHPGSSPDGKSIKISGVKKDATVSDTRYGFEAVPGHYYITRGWMRGDNINPEASCKIKIEFYGYKTFDPIAVADKNHLQGELQFLADYGTYYNLPVMMGEFGTITRGASAQKDVVTYTTDMLDLADQMHLNYAYRAYNNSQWGIYSPPGSPGQAPNNALVELFKSRLKGGK